MSTWTILAASLLIPAILITLLSSVLVIARQITHHRERAERAVLMRSLAPRHTTARRTAAHLTGEGGRRP